MARIAHDDVPEHFAARPDRDDPIGAGSPGSPVRAISPIGDPRSRASHSRPGGQHGPGDQRSQAHAPPQPPASGRFGIIG
jgi:hypothetical protein